MNQRSVFFTSIAVYLSFGVNGVLTENENLTNIENCDIDKIHNGDDIILKFDSDNRLAYFGVFTFPNEELTCKIGKLNMKFINDVRNRRYIGFGYRMLFLPNSNVTADELKLMAIAKNIDKINVAHNNIAHISYDIFPERNHLEYLDLSFNNITELPPNSFHRLAYMLELFLTNNKIVKIPALLFHTMDRIAALDLSFNQIDEIHTNSFPILCKLQILNLSQNNITALNMTEMHLQFTQMKRLLLSNNQIIELPSNLFSHMKELEELDLSFNKIAKFDDSALSGNFELRKLDLSENKLSKLSDRMFSDLVQLRHLNLSQNRLIEIEFGTFSKLENLKSLDLSENQLTKFDLNIFPTEPNVMFKMLNISNNELKELINFTGENTPHVVVYGIDSNRINCTHFKQIVAKSTAGIVSSKLVKNCISNGEKFDESAKVGIPTPVQSSVLPTTPPTASATVKVAAPLPPPAAAETTMNCASSSPITNQQNDIQIAIDNVHNHVMQLEKQLNAMTWFIGIGSTTIIILLGFILQRLRNTHTRSGQHQKDEIKMKIVENEYGACK